MLFSRSYRVLALVLAIALCGVPELLAQSRDPQPQQTQPDINTAPPQPAPDQQDQAPATTTDQALPNAPSAQQPQLATPPVDSSSKIQEPAGTAAAGKPTTVGGAASKPAGTAIAPAKQRQVRSWLIKIGAVAAAGAALGIVYGLSKSTSSKPPGATTPTPAATPVP